MLLTKTIKLKPMSLVNYYKNKGYIIPPIKDKRGRATYRNSIIEVKIEDLPLKSQEIVEVECDYCKKSFNVLYSNYNRSRKTIKKDSCEDCKYEKIKDINIYKYGTNSMIEKSKIIGFKVGRNKINFNIIKQEFINKGVIPLFDEQYYIDNNCNVCTLLPCICERHRNKGALYVSYDDIRTRETGCKYCMSESIRIGENNNNWKGGTSSERDIIKATNKYRQWRELVFKRDNYTCQCCGDNTGHNLEAHHIENFSDHEELRFDVNNGITLCNKCHNPNQKGSFHNIYGTHNNTKEQLEEYIKVRNERAI